MGVVIPFGGSTGAPLPSLDALVGLVAETGCRYFEALAFPDAVAAGLRGARLGRTSVRYEIDDRGIRGCAHRLTFTQ